MDLKTVFSSVGGKIAKTDSSPEKYLAVKISSTNIIATVWFLDGGTIHIGSVEGSEIKAASWEGLLKAADEAISAATTSSEAEVTKVIFAVPLDWVHEEKILPDHLKTLRRLCKELDLLPQGYVVLTEALENFFKDQEGAPLTAVLVGIDGDKTTLTLYRAGKNLGTVPVGLEDLSPSAFPEALEKALKRFPDVEVLPARIMIYNGRSDLSKVAEKITAYPWTQKLPFLHFPKVETIPAEFVVKAVAASAGREMGGKINLESEVETFATSSEEEKKAPAPSAEEEPVPFVSEKKELEREAVEESSKIALASELEEVSAEEAGFIAGDDSFKELEIPVHPHPSVKSQPAASLEELPFSKASHPSKSKLDLFSAIFTPLSKAFARLLRVLPSLITRFRLPLPKASTHPQVGVASSKSTFPLPRFLILPGVLLLLFFGALASGLLLPKAAVLIYVSPKPFSHTLEVTISTGPDASPGAKVIPGEFVKSTQMGTKKGLASGSKLVGDKAKGAVTIYSVSTARTFPEGTTLTADGLKFTLDREVKVASGDAVTPATAKVDVTAGDIGEKYNLASGAKFTIGNFSSSEYLAKNDSSLTGGNSHQATVVTKADQDRLLASLTTELTEKAKEALNAELSDGATLLPNAITSVTTKKVFSKDIDAEADTFSLDLTMDFQGVIFSHESMVELFKTTYASDIPSGYSLSPSSATPTVKTAKTDKNGNSILEVTLDAKLLPEINVSDLQDKLPGKGTSAAEKIILATPGVSRVNFDVTPKFLAFFSGIALPLRKENLTLEVVSD